MNEFLNSALKIGEQVIILFILMFVGFISTKTKLITDKSISGFVNVLLYIVTPCLIINSFLSVKFTSDTLKYLLVAAGCAVLSHIIGIAVSYLIHDKEETKKSVYRFGTVFSNAGYMGLPLAQAVFGNEGVFYGSVYVVVFNIIQWTYGITLYNKSGNSKLKTLINPGTIGVIVGLPLFLMKVTLPEIIGTPLGYLSSLNTPIAMLVTGYYFALSDVKKGIKNAKMWIAIALRMTVIPMLALLLFKYGFGMSGVLLCSCVLPASAPTAVNTMVLASKYGADTDIALKLVTVSTALSIITMPLILAFAQM